MDHVRPFQTITIGPFKTILDNCRLFFNNFRPFSVILGQFGQLGSILDHVGPVWTSLDLFGPVWTNLESN